MLLIEDGIGDPPSDSHYRFRQSGTSAEHRVAAEQHLQRQGCTKVVHHVQDEILISLGYVERLEVVAQRRRQPQYG